MYLRYLVILLLLVFSTLGVSTTSYAFKGFDLSGLGGTDPAEELLPDDQAFQILSSRIDNDHIVVTWISAPVDYYLYRKNFKLVSKTEGISFGELILPEGDKEDDPLFGSVEVYFGEVDVRAKIIRQNTSATELAFEAHAQGCNKPVGICYPPQTRFSSVNLEAANDASTQLSSTNAEAGRTKNAVIQSTSTAQRKSYWTYILSAFGAGLLLVFTPCVLPMLPILSGLVVGSQNDSSGKLKAGALSLAYVLGTAVTYTAMGIAAGAAGIQLQAYFQHPIAIMVMIAILVVLALAMFGLFDIALPSSAQSRLSAFTNRMKGGSLPVAFIVGLLSALIVSACVSPLLITALGVAIKEGSPLLGGLMMFSMAMGMGVLLIAFGMGAGWLMPKAGEWMNQVKVLFGFAILAVAIVVASSLKWMPVMFLWAALLTLFGFWVWSLSSNKSFTKTTKNIIYKALAFLSLLWASIAFIGGFTGAQDILNPLSELSLNGTQQSMSSVQFEKVVSGDELERAVAEAKLQGKPVLVDYYADWCTDCKRMDRSTYKSQSIIDGLSSWSRIKVDVTAVNSGAQKAKDQFGVFGPPATLFIDSSGVERKDLWRYGYINEVDMLGLIQATSK